MLILQIVGMVILITVLASVLKQIRPEIALQLVILTSLGIFLLVMDQIGLVLELLQALSERAEINSYYLAIILKIVGVAYLAEFGGQICKDAGENALAVKVELAAKVFVVVLAVPIIAAIMDSMLKLLS